MDKTLIGLGGVSFNSIIPLTFLNATKSPVPNSINFLTFFLFLYVSIGSISTIPGHEFDIDLIKYFWFSLPLAFFTMKSFPKSLKRKDDKPNCAVYIKAIFFSLQYSFNASDISIFIISVIIIIW